MAKALPLIATAFLLTLSVTGVQAADVKSDTYLETAAGTLELSKRQPGDKTVVTLADKSIFETTEFMSASIHSALTGAPKPDRVLLFFNTGGSGCAGFFRIVDVATGGVMSKLTDLFSKQQIVSTQFGSCDDAPVILSQGEQIVFDFRGADGIERWAYTLSSRKLTQLPDMTWDSYKPIKMQRIAEAGAKALRASGKQLDDFGNLSTVHESFLDKMIPVENGSATISDNVRLGHVLALALASGMADAVTPITLRTDASVKGFSVRLKKPTSDFAAGSKVVFLFRERGNKLFYAFAGVDRLIALETADAQSHAAAALWELMAADAL